MDIVSTLGRLKEETVTSSSPVIAIREFQVIFSYGERILSQVPGQPLAMECKQKQKKKLETFLFMSLFAYGTVYPQRPKEQVGFPGAGVKVVMSYPILGL